MEMMNSTYRYTGLRKILYFVVGVLTILPLAPLINRFIPPLMIGTWNMDLLLSIILASVFTFTIIRVFHFLLLPALILFVGVILYNQFHNNYGFGRMINDYQSMVRNNWGKKEEKRADLVLTPSFFDGPLTRTVRRIDSKIDHKDSVVRNFAVHESLKFFDDYHAKYGNLARVFSLFKSVNSKFKYVSDSQRDEYFATGRETILNGMGGDCDDHTILMVSVMRSIGARCRMILTEGHLYPELYCGEKKDFAKIQDAVILMFGDDVKGNIFFHEQEGKYWLNLDYSARYPGGPYVNQKAFAIFE